MATTNATASPTGIDLAEKLATFSEPWQPRVVGQFNGHDLMVAKLKGEFTWHTHDDTDEGPAPKAATPEAVQPPPKLKEAA